MGTIDDFLTQSSDYLQNMAFKSLRTYLSINYPWTNIVVVKQLVDLVLNKLLTILFTKTEYGIYSLAVNEIVREQKNALNEAFKSNDEQKIIEAARNFIKLSSP